MAERKSTPKEFFDADIDWEKQEGLEELGEKFTYKESWGEAMFEIKKPVLAILNVQESTVSVLDTIPDDVHPMSAQFTPNDEGIVFYGLKASPFKLGKVYCDNRPGALYFYGLDDEQLRTLGEENVSIAGLNISPNKEIVYFQHPATGPHQGTYGLYKLDSDHAEKGQEIIPIVKKPAKLGDFPGFYVPIVPQRPWANDGKRFVFSTQWGSKIVGG